MVWQPIPAGNPLNKHILGTTLSRRCKAIIRGRQGIWLGQTVAVPSLREFSAVGARVCGPVLRGVWSSSVGEAVPVPGVRGRPHLAARGVSAGAAVSRGAHRIGASGEDRGQEVAAIGEPADPAVLVAQPAPLLFQPQHTLDPFAGRSGAVLPIPFFSDDRTMCTASSLRVSPPCFCVDSPGGLW